MNNPFKKILIITYYFPPANFPASYRVYSWAKYFYKFGYYPVIITRRWEKEVSTYWDVSLSTNDEILHEKNNNYEVYYLPYKGNFRDRLLNTYGDRKFKMLRKLLSFSEFVLQNFFLNIIPYSNLYSFSLKYLKNNSDVSYVLISGSPFIMFKFGYYLHKRTGVNWIADYRDEWNTLQFKAYRKLTAFVSFFEKKWVSSCIFFISCSDEWVKRISKLTKAKGYVVMNGYDEEDFTNITIKQKDRFIISYNGSLYTEQPIEIFIVALKKIINEYKDKLHIEILFIGIGVDQVQVERIYRQLNSYQEHYKIFPRIPKEDTIELISNSDLLLLVGIPEIVGLYTTKLYEYLRTYQPIILCPSDHDVIEDLILQTNTGFVCNNSTECEIILKKLIDEHLESGKINIIPDKNKIKIYSRENQTKILAELLKKYKL